MSVKDVVRNIRTKGILGTYQIYKNRPNYLPRRIYHFIQEKQDQGRFLAYLSNLSKYDLPEIENIDDSLSQERAQCTTEFQKKFEEYEEKMGGRSSTDFYYEEAIQDKTILLLGLNKNIRGNMRYILDELNTNPEFDNYKIYVRTSNETDSSVKECIQESDWMRTSTVKSTGKYDRLLASARFLITEVFFPAGWVKKEGQLYINIWHGTPLKKLGLAKFSNNIHKDGIKQRDFIEANYLLYPNEYAKKNLLGSYKVKDLVEGKIVNLGYPRTGGMLAAAQSDQTDLLEQLAPNHETLYAYMPTWKDYLSEEQVLEETKELLDYLDENLTDDQILYVNLHHKVNDSLDYSAYKRIKRFPATIDNYRLLAMTDALITDYSSVFYDYLALGRQIILYCADFDIYKKRRGVYMDLDELPFDKARTPEEVVDALNRGKTYDDAEAIQRFCAYDTVNNARDLCGLLLGKTGNISLEEIQKNNEKRVLIYSHTFEKSADTSRLKGFLNLEKDYQVYIGCEMFEVDKNKDSAYPIFHQVPVIGVTEDFHIGRAGKVALNLYQEGKMTFDKAMELLQYDYGIAYKRMFGSAKFDLVFIYDLADPEMLLALSFMPVDKKMFYLSDAAYQKLQDGDQFFLDAVKYALPKMGRVYVNTKEKANCLKKICNVNVLLQRGNRAKDLGNQIYRYINPKGIIQTHALSSQRKQTEKRRREESALYEEIIGAICNGKTLQECSENIQKYISSLNNNVSLDLDSYNTKLAKLCVNHLLPDVYEEKSNSPIKNKIVFLYPKDDKSLFLQYLYNEYVNEGDAKALLYELDQEQDALDLYGEMVSVVKEMADSNKVYVYGLDDLINHINFREETEITNIVRFVDERKFYLRQLHKGNEKASINDGKELKRICIKEILPEVYQRYCGRPLRNKAVFLQPRKGVNQSFLYIYNKIKEEQLYDVSLHELHRGEVEDCEYYCNAIDFVKDIATAKVVFEHESNDLLGYVDIRPETKIIQLWHGCGIFKKIGLDTYGKPGYKTMEEYEEYPEYNKYSLVTIASPELSWVYEQFMGIDKESGIIQPIGVSRTDEFFDESYIKNCYDKLYERIPQAREKKVILYAPTYRGLGQHRVSPDELNVKQFADALSDDYILIFKHHQTAIDLPEIPEEYRDKFAFDMTRGRGMNINELLTVADICISDYSSLVFEYSLFERPIMFFVYDLEEYMDNRGLYYDFDEITPGPLCKTNEEMIEYIKHIDERFDKEAVTDFKNRFMCACDGHSTERILKFIEQ